MNTDFSFDEKLNTDDTFYYSVKSFIMSTFNNRYLLQENCKNSLEILDKIEAQIPAPREEVSKYAPKTVTFMIDPLKIKEVIGKGGETITKIILEASNVNAVNDINAVKVDIDDDGRVIIYHTDKEVIDKTANMIKDIVRTPEEGKIYNAKVVKIIDAGCFVEIWPGCEGMVHISELNTERVEKVTDIVKEGDEIIVKCMGYDKRGRLNLSRKEVLLKNRPKKEEKIVQIEKNEE